VATKAGFENVERFEVPLRHFLAKATIVLKRAEALKLKIVPKEEVREALGRSPDVGDTFLMRMYFELLKDAAGNPNAPYAPSVAVLRGRHGSREIRPRGV
jgi:hypothetical protein